MEKATASTLPLMRDAEKILIKLAPEELSDYNQLLLLSVMCNYETEGRK